MHSCSVARLRKSKSGMGKLLNPSSKRRPVKIVNNIAERNALKGNGDNWLKGEVVRENLQREGEEA